MKKVQNKRKDNSDDSTIGIEAEQRDDQSWHANHLALVATIGMAACVGT